MSSGAWPIYNKAGQTQEEDWGRERGGIEKFAMLCCAVLCCAVLCCAVLCCDMLWGEAEIKIHEWHATGQVRCTLLDPSALRWL